ncbi:MAG: UvrD-helicase domain-containing protein [Armatimonadetes bacterium]|nr:UvrD-helicase domain-containing protein [Armatimonadota bacterium]
MQATLDAITEDLHRLRAQSLLPALEAGLNEQQIQAFHHGDGPCLVLAGAGSGKTTVLTRRVARLLAEGAAPERLFVATFTKKAADQMKERLARLLGEGGDAIVEKLWIGTFHAHCLRILKHEWAHLYGKAGYFQLADENWQVRVAKAILGDKDWMARGLPSPPFGLNVAYDPKGALSAVSAVKNRGHDVAEAERAFREHEPDWADSAIQTLCKFWRCYEQAKQAKFDLLAKKPSRRLDFDDLLIETLRLLQEHKDVREKYQRHFQYVLIDETQDTSRVQWEISRLLCAGHGNIFIVGDVGQAIYSFRGCSPEATVGQYGGAYPNGAIIRLPANYRSSATIVRAANELIGRAGIDARYRLAMAATQGEGDAPSRHEHATAEDEAQWVAETLKGLQSCGAMLQDCAVLFRTNAYSRALEEAFVQGGVPYVLQGALGFYARREVRDLCAFLQLTVERDSPAADEAVRRVLNVPSRKFGKPTHFLGHAFVAEVETQAARQGCSLYKILQAGQFKTSQGLAVKDFRDMIKDIHGAGEGAEERLRAARALGYDEWLLREEGHVEDEGNSRLDNLEELCVAARAFPSPKDFLDFVAAQNRPKEGEEAGDAVEMMTIHRAKGLEWPNVFVVGFAFGMLPHHRSLRWQDEDRTQLLADSIEEERRLAYVALTRAKSRVYLSWPLQHQTRALTRSPFLAEMPSLGPDAETPE